LALTWAELKATGGDRDVEDDDAARVAAHGRHEKGSRWMPRTMLRYAIERFPEAERRRYLAGLV